MNHHTGPADPKQNNRLPDSSTLFTMLANSLDARETGLCLWDAEDCAICWNQSFARIFSEISEILAPGVTFQNCLRYFFQANLSEQELPLIERHIEAAQKRRKQTAEPYLYRRKNGSWIKFEWQHADGGHSIILVNDVSDDAVLSRAGSEVQSSAAPQIQDVFANIDVAFALFNKEGGFISANRYYFDLFPECVRFNYENYSYRSHLQQHSETALDDNDRERLRLLSQRDIDTIEDNYEILIFRRDDETWLALEERRTAKGALLVIWHDVSERVQAQQQVLALQERLSDAIENLADAFALFDRDDRLVICNTRYLETAGFEPEDITPGAAWYDMVKRCLARGQYPEAIGREEQWIEERRLKRRQGNATQEIYFNNGTWLMATDRRTREGGTVSIGTDITALKNREQQLSRQAAMLNAISAAAAELIGRGEWQVMIDEMLARLGQAAQVSRVMIFRVHPLNNGELGQSCQFEWLAPTVPSVKQHPMNQSEPVKAFDQVRAQWLQSHQSGDVIQSKVSELDGYLREKFDREDVLSIISVPIVVDGDWWGHISFQDCSKERTWTSVEIDVLKTAALLIAEIVERSRVDTQLRDSEQRFRSMAEALPIIITHYETGTIVYASPPLGDMLDMPAKDLLGLPVIDIYADPQQRHSIQYKLREQNILDDEELLYKRADGSLLPATITSRRIIYGGEIAIISAITDLTERKTAETELAQQREALHHADKMSALGSLLAGVAHELNNPLAILVGQAMLMEETTQAFPDVNNRAVKIRNAAERCGRIVKTFLSMARQRPAERSEVHFEQIIDTVLDLTDYSVRANDIVVQRAIDPALPVIWGDQDQFSQLLLNLVINAQQALLSVSGPRLLRVSAQADRNDPNFVILEVADSGPGVPQQDWQRVFEPFFTTKPVGMGTGIGLSLCHSIVISHSGTIEVRNAPEGGALFRVRLPLGQAAVRPGYQTGPADNARKDVSDPILIVDDEPEIAEMLAEILQGAGYQTTQAGSGRAALQQLAKQRFGLILSDIRMPDLDGPGLYKALAEQYPSMQQRIIFVTGDILQSSDTISLKKQVPIIEKPFDPDVIEQIVNEQLSKLGPVT